jgi:hypothetical protein
MKLFVCRPDLRCSWLELTSATVECAGAFRSRVFLDTCKLSALIDKRTVAHHLTRCSSIKGGSLLEQ